MHTANIGDNVVLPCSHNLEQPVTFEWKREFIPLSPQVRSTEVFSIYEILRFLTRKIILVNLYVIKINRERILL